MIFLWLCILIRHYKEHIECHIQWKISVQNPCIHMGIYRKANSVGGLALNFYTGSHFEKNFDSTYKNPHFSFIISLPWRQKKLFCYTHSMFSPTQKKPYGSYYAHLRCSTYFSIRKRYIYTYGLDTVYGRYCKIRDFS